MWSYQYENSHCGDKTILRPSYLHNGISYTGKMSYLYWIRAQELRLLYIKPSMWTANKQFTFVEISWDWPKIVDLIWHHISKGEIIHTWYPTAGCFILMHLTINRDSVVIMFITLDSEVIIFSPRVFVWFSVCLCICHDVCSSDLTMEIWCYTSNIFAEI